MAANKVKNVIKLSHEKMELYHVLFVLKLLFTVISQVIEGMNHKNTCVWHHMANTCRGSRAYDIIIPIRGDLSMKTTKKTYVFYSFLISYILILLIPLVLGSFVYLRTFNEMQDEAVNASISMLEQGRNVLDTRLQEIQGLVRQISFSSNISKLLVGKVDHILNLNMVRDLQTYRINNSFIRTCIIYIRDKALMITPNGSTDRESFFYESSFITNGQEYESWHKEFWSTYYPGIFMPSVLNQSLNYNSPGENSISFVQSLPIGNTKKDPQGMIILDINQSEITQLLQNIAGKNGWAYISNENGEIIASVNESNYTPEVLSSDSLNKKENIGILKRDNDFIVLYTVSPYNGWIYVLGHPTGNVMNKVNAFQNLMITILLAILISGTFVSLILANKNSRPIRKLIDIIKANFNSANDSKSANTFEFIYGSISELLRNNEELKAEIQEKIPILKSAFLDRLLRGSFISMRELKNSMSNIGMNLDACKYLVLVLKIEDYEKTGEDRVMNELNIAKVVTSKAISSVFQDKVLLHEVSEDMLAGVLLFSFDDEDQIRNVVRNIALEVGGLLKRNNNIHVSFSSGLAYTSLTDIYNSFREALEALEYKAVDDEDIVRWYIQSTEQQSYYYYPLEIESKLISLCSAGDMDEIKEILKQLYIENFKKRKISDTMLFAFLDEIQGTLIKIASKSKYTNTNVQTALQGKMDSFTTGKSVEEYWRKIRDLYEFVCNEIFMEKNKNESNLFCDILNYLHTCYKEQQTCRTSVASRFNMTEVYLSRFFKEHAGENFSHYLEKIRIEKARQLIKESELPISVIAEQVGYNSARVFRRAYKRLHGEIPSSLR